MVAPLLLGYNEILVNVTVSNIDVTGNILSKIYFLITIGTSFTEDVALIAWTLALFMIIAGIGAGMFIVAGTQNASMQKLLKEGDFTEKEKKRTRVKEIVGFCYWGVLTAIYLAVSFLNNQWHLSWIIFTVGGVLFPVVMCICNYIADKDNKG